MRALTRYEPESASTDDDNDSDRFLGITQPLGKSHYSNQPSKTVLQHATEQSVLKKVDVEILRIITGLADQRAYARARAEKEQQQQDIYGTYNYNGKVKEEDEDLDFVDAFQAFEAFTETNKLTRNSYNNYFTALNILVNLCEQEPIPQERDTWTARLMAYLKTYSASELRRAKATLMRARLHSFDNRTRNRFLGLWYESSAVLHERDQRLGEIAAQYDWCRAVSGKIQVWTERLAEQHAKQNTASLLADRRLKRYAFDKLLGRCQAVTVAEEVADRVAKTQFLRRWMRRYHTQVERNQLAKLFYKRSLKERYLLSVDQAKVEIQTERVYNHKLAADAFAVWVNRTKRAVEMDDYATNEDRTVLVNDVFQQWVRSFDIVDDLYAHAEEASDKLALKHTLAIWKRRTNHDVTLRNVLNKKETNLLKTVFASWNKKAADYQRARKLNEYNICTNSLKIWQLNTRANQVITVREEEMLQSSLVRWQVNTRLRLFTTLRNTSLTAGVLKHWRIALDEIEIRTHDRYASYRAVKDEQLAGKFLAIWHTRAVAQAKREAAATKIYNQEILRHAFYSFMYRDDQLLDQADVADQKYRAASLKLHFGKWKAALIHSKTQHREAALEEFQRERALRLADKYFNVWFGRYIDVDELNVSCDELTDARESTMKREVLVTWAERARTIAESTFIADRLLVGRTFERWQAERERVAQLNSIADDLILANNLQLIERTYRAWRMRMFKVRTKVRDADDFNKQLGEQRFKAVWRFWKLRTWELQNERAFMQVAPTSQRKQQQQQQYHQSYNFLQQQDSVMRSYSMLRRPLVHLTTTTNSQPVPQMIAFPSADSVTTNPAAAVVDDDDEYIPETPTRPRVRKTVPYTSLGRWRRTRTPGTLGTLPRFEPTTTSKFPIAQSNAAAVSPSDGR